MKVISVQLSYQELYFLLSSLELRKKMSDLNSHVWAQINFVSKNISTKFHDPATKKIRIVRDPLEK